MEIPPVLGFYAVAYGVGYLQQRAMVRNDPAPGPSPWQAPPWLKALCARPLPGSQLGFEPALRQVFALVGLLCSAPLVLANRLRLLTDEQVLAALLLVLGVLGMGLMAATFLVDAPAPAAPHAGWSAGKGRWLVPLAAVATAVVLGALLNAAHIL